MPHYLFGDTDFIIQFPKLFFSTKLFIFIFLLSCDYVIYSECSDEMGRNNYTEKTLFSVTNPTCAVSTATEKGYEKSSSEEYEKKEPMIYILIWSTKHVKTWSEEKVHSFIQHQCSSTNCYLTLDRNLFGDDITKFDAIVFDGTDLVLRNTKLPMVRSFKQKYMFFSQEPAENFPICNETYDGFFNWTVTYKLDSDIVFSYFHIKNNNGEVVGPKRNMEWVTDMEEIDKQLEKRLRHKTKAAAWFVSRCDSKTDRNVFVRNLQKHLNKYNLTVDVYGKCGSLQCPRSQSDVCDAMLEKDYYFYLALENSFDEDYVTEKVLRAMQNNVVPIVYGGANYSRFLPPGSYIDGRAYSAYDLADIMYGLMLSQTAYSQYFRWKKYYTYHDSMKHNICKLCDTTNEEKLHAFSMYKHFRKWWNDDFKEACISDEYYNYISEDTTKHSNQPAVEQRERDEVCSIPPPDD